MHVTRYRLALDPKGAASIVSDRVPGSIVGQGDLHGWIYAPGRKWSSNFKAVNRDCRRCNRGRSRDPIGEDGT